MSSTLSGLFAVLLVVVIVGLAWMLIGSWQRATRRSSEDDKFDQNIASYNTRLAHRRRDDEIVRILRGRDMPTLADREGRRTNDPDDDYDDDDE